MHQKLFHSLEGEKLYFKPLNTDDTLAIHSYASDPIVSKYIGWRLMETVEETNEYINEMIKREAAETHLYASIVLKSTEDIIGTAMIFSFNHDARHAEVGYVFHRDYWGKSYGTESLGLMNRFATEVLGLHKLHARVVNANIGSTRILEKSGFQLEGCQRDYHFIEGKYYDSLLLGKILDSHKV